MITRDHGLPASRAQFAPRSPPVAAGQADRRKTLLKLEDPTRLDCRDLVPPGFLVRMLRPGVHGVGQVLFRSVTAVARRR
jgi:hypothetical protein